MHTNDQCVFYVLISNVKWGHLAHFEPNSTNTIFSTILWGHLAHFEPNSTNTIFSTILWGHLAHFEPGSIFHNYYNLNCELVP